MIKTNIPEIPYETLVRKVIGEGWRTLSNKDLDGALGVLIVRSVLDGVRPRLDELERHLSIESSVLRDAFMRLSLNGFFLRRSSRIYGDSKSLNSNDFWAWGQYAGIASGVIGNVRYQPRRPKFKKDSTRTAV